jgi:hypothetical protein
VWRIYSRVPVLIDQSKGAAGKPQSFVAKYEGGERRIDVVEFVTICRALEVDPMRLLKALLKSDR